MSTRIFLLLLASMVPAPARGGGVEDSLRLHRDMFQEDRYNVNVRPARSYDRPTNVSVQVFVSGLIGLNMPEQTMHLTGFVKVNWTDDQMKWNSSDYGGVDSMLVSQDDVWRPDLVFADSRHEEGEIYMGNENTKCEITSDGHVRWTPAFNMKFACKVDTHKYPFDEDFCYFKIAQHIDDKSRVLLLPEHMDLTHMLPSRTFYLEYHEWHRRTDFFQFNNESYDTLMFELKLARRPQYAALSLLLPLILISLLCVVPYLFKPDEADKFGVASSLLLSFTVFLDVLHANLPENSENIGVLALYVTAMISLAFVSSLGNGIVFAYHCWTEDTQPHYPPPASVDGKDTDTIALNGGSLSEDHVVRGGGGGGGGKGGRGRNKWPWFLRLRGESGPVVVNNLFMFGHVILFTVFTLWLFIVLLSEAEHEEEALGQ